MRAANNWLDYEIIDTSDGEKLERWNDIILVRPDPQVIWKSEKKNELWNNYHGRYYRSSKGGGHWDFKKQTPDKWNIGYGDLTFNITPTNFKHTGLFPEQAANWDVFMNLIKKRTSEGKKVKVLNLFAYTGGASLACLSAGAEVTHVDASKGMVSWASENVKLSGLVDKPCRWIVDDCEKFVSREIKRGNFYDAVIMDPPSYGRGPNGEVWKLEEKIFDFVKLTCGVLSNDPVFFAINSYTTGLNPSAMEYILSLCIKEKVGENGFITSDEIGVPVTESKLVLPCGSTALWTNEKTDI